MHQELSEPLSLCLCLYTCVKALWGVFSYQTTAVPQPCFLFLCQLFPSAGLTRSLLDNSASLLPVQASCFHCTKFSNQELVLPASQQACFCCTEVGQSRVHGNTLSWEQNTEKDYMHVLMYQQSKFWLSSGVDQRDTHTQTHRAVRERRMRFQTLSVQCLLKTICFFLSCCSVFLCTPSLLIIPGPNTLITASLTSFRQLLISSKKRTQ